MIQTQTFEGLPGGIDQLRPPHVVDPNEAVYMQDILLHRPGLMARRGKLSAISGAASIAFRATGIVATQDYTGTYKVAVLAGTAGANGAKIHLLNAALTSVTAVYQLNSTGSDGSSVGFPDTPRTHAIASSALGGGTLIGTSTSLRGTPSAATNLALWKGATKPDWTATHNMTATLGSSAVTIVTGGFSANVESGMFLFADAAYQTLIGVVATVTSDTALVLEDPALFSVAGAICYFRPMRGLMPRATTGTLTVVSGKTAVTGQNTKFSTQNLQNGTWDLFRLADLTYIGTVASVTSDLSLTLTGNSSIGMTTERYVGIKRGSGGAGANYSFSTTDTTPGVNRKLGWITTTYAGRQWYANRPLQSASNDYASRVWFSDTQDLEGVNVNKDGDWFNVQSLGSANTPVIGLLGLPNSLMIFKETELWSLVGTDTASFALRKVADLSLLGPQAAYTYGSGVVFAAAEGIFFYDGVRLENLTAKLGTFYEKAIAGWATGTDQCRGFLNRGHAFFSFSKFADPVGVTKNGSTTSPTALTIAINMDSGALTYLTNTQFWGGVDMPPASGFSTLTVVNSANPVTSIVDSNTFFDTPGIDTITCEGRTAGPDFYLETARFDVGDPERKKLYKQIAMQYISAGGALNVDTIPGMNSTGTQALSVFAAQTTFVNKRIKFLKRSTHMGFRLYQNSNSITDVQIGPFAIGFKPQRVGRV